MMVWHCMGKIWFFKPLHFTVFKLYKRVWIASWKGSASQHCHWYLGTWTWDDNMVGITIPAFLFFHLPCFFQCCTCGKSKFSLMKNWKNGALISLSPGVWVSHLCQLLLPPYTCISVGLIVCLFVTLWKNGFSIDWTWYKKQLGICWSIPDHYEDTGFFWYLLLRDMCPLTTLQKNVSTDFHEICRISGLHTRNKCKYLAMLFITIWGPFTNID